MKRRLLVVFFSAALGLLPIAPGAVPLPKGAPDLDKVSAPESLVKIDGETIRAVNAACKRLQSMNDLTARQKHIENYTIGFSQDDRAIYVFFDPKPAPGSKLETIASNDNGVGMIIAVQHKSGKVLAAYGEG